MAIFGSAEGTSRAMADLGQEQTRQLYKQQTEANLAGEALNQKLTGLKIEQARHELDQQKTFMALLGKGDIPGTPQEKLQQVADAQIKSGLVNEGVNTLYKLSMYNSMETNQAVAKQRQAAAQLKYEISLLSGVNSAEDWDKAKMIYQGQGMQLPPELANMPYSPQMVQYFKNIAQTEYQKQMEGLRALAEGRQQTSAAITDQIHNIELDNLRQGLPAKPTKAGTRMPSSTFLKGAESALGTVFDVTRVPEAELNDVSRAVADDAMGLMEKNPGLKSGEALHQAILRQQKVTGTWPKKGAPATASKPAADTKGAFYKMFGVPPLPEGDDNQQDDEGSY